MQQVSLLHVNDYNYYDKYQFYNPLPVLEPKLYLVYQIQT